MRTGAIVRSAAAFAISQIILIGNGALEPSSDTSFLSSVAPSALLHATSESPANTDTKSPHSISRTHDSINPNDEGNEVKTKANKTRKQPYASSKRTGKAKTTPYYKKKFIRIKWWTVTPIALITLITLITRC